MFESSKWVWMNGKIVPWEKATVHVSAHALHYGTAFFEGIRCYETDEGPAIFRLPDHVNRLVASAAAYDVKIPFSPEVLEGACADVVRKNEFKTCYLRPLCYFGSATLGVHPREPKIEVAILAWPWPSFFAGAQAMEEGLRVSVSSWRKFHFSMIPTTSKGAGGYLNSVLAVTEAVKRGYNEALLVNQEGNIAEGSGENVFIVRNKALITNDERSSILLGITRESVMQIARDRGMEVKIQAFSPADLLSADEAFFTGTAAEIAAITEVDGKKLGSGKRGPVTRLMAETYTQATHGKLPQYKHWLYPVKEEDSSKSPLNHARAQERR